MNDHGDLVLALDRYLSDACPVDGAAELAFLFHPRESEHVAGLVGATSKPVDHVTVASGDGWLHVSTGDGRGWLLTTSGADVEAGSVTRVEGLAVSRVDRGIRAVGLEETLAAYRGFDLVRGSGGG